MAQFTCAKTTTPLACTGHRVTLAGVESGPRSLSPKKSPGKLWGRNAPMDRKRMGMGREAGYAYEDYRKGAAGPKPLESVLSSRPRGTGSSSFSTMVPIGQPRHAFLLGSWGETGQSCQVPEGRGFPEADAWRAGLKGLPDTGSQGQATVPPRLGQLHTHAGALRTIEA